ncbi:MAG: glutamine--fructose-6-phosphate transaminase (isomerizing) [Opitutales bacterium]
MCGIVGYVGAQSASAILLEGLKRLEYRGYDSAGVALLDAETLTVLKKSGRVENMSRLVRQRKPAGQLGIGHTRWATHGGVTDQNAHPHLSADGRISLVHNGVIENHLAIRRELEAQGVTFRSETDTEALCNLIAFYYAQERAEDGNDPERALMNAVRFSLRQVEGTYGIAVLCADLPQTLIGARKGSPLVLGVGRGENLLASDVAAFAGRTKDVVYLDDGQLVRLGPEDFSISTIDDELVEPRFDQITWETADADLGHFAHFMLKEIFEQPLSLENAMRGRFAADGSTCQFGGLNMSPREIRQIDRILFMACGTAWHACLVAEYLIEKYARIPVEVEYASEFRYRNAPLDKNTLVWTISQSGETIDTLEAQREAQRKGFRVLGLTNAVGSTIARENDGGIYQHSGPEIGVASTKAFTSQIHLAAMIALYLGRMRDMSFEQGSEIVRALKTAPGLVNQVLGQAEQIKTIADKYAHHDDFLFLGRQLTFPIALEGALKLKEISYIHAEGYPAAEMKHGPIALICARCPTVVIAPRGDMLKKILSNIQEIKARQGPVIAITNAPKEFPDGLADDLIVLPDCHEVVMPVLATIPLQFLAYYIGVGRGQDVDKPRNLAKSVTVE